MPADSASSWTTVDDFLQNGDSRAAKCFRQTQWDQLCLVASNANRHLECVALDQVTSGLNNVVRLLEFSDRSRWAARIQIKTTGNAKLKTEVATMQYIKEHSDLAVPRVFPPPPILDKAETASDDYHGGALVDLTAQHTSPSP